MGSLLAVVMAVMAVAAVSACSSAGRGVPAPGTSPSAKAIVVPPTTPRAPVGEAGADWVAANLNGCELMTGPRLAAMLRSQPAPRDDAECEAEVRLPTGEQSLISVTAPADFSNVNRARHRPITVAGLGAYHAVHQGGGCSIELPLSATRSVRVSAIGAKATSCAVVLAGAEDVAEYLRGPKVAASGPLGFPAGERDDDLDLECQFINGATPESCRRAYLIDLGEVDEILGLPPEVAGHAACSMLAEPFREAVGKQIELAVLGTNCFGRTVDGTVDLRLGTFAYAKLDDYCGSTDRAAIVLDGRRATVCGRASDTSRDITVAVHADVARNGVLLADLQLNPPRGVLGDEPDRTFEVTVLDRILERVLRDYF